MSSSNQSLASDNHTKSSTSLEPSLFDTFREHFSDHTQQALHDYDAVFRSRLEALRQLKQDITPDIRAQAILTSIRGIPVEQKELRLAALLAYISVYNPTFDMKHLCKPVKTAFSEILIEGDTSLTKRFEFSETLQKELHYLLDSNQQFMHLPKERRDELDGKIQHSFVYISPGSGHALNEKPHELKHILRPYTEFYIQKFMYAGIIPLDLSNEVFLSCESALHAVLLGIMAALCNTSFEEIKMSYFPGHELFDVENIFEAYHYMCQQTFAVKHKEHVNLLIFLCGMDAFKAAYSENDEWMDPLYELASRSIMEHEKVDTCLTCMGTERLYQNVQWEHDGFACEKLVIPSSEIPNEDEKMQG